MKCYFLGLLLAFSIPVSRAPGAEFFVSPHGTDSASGTYQHPFASLARAQQAAREALAAKPGAGITVTLLAGTYSLAEPLAFTAADSGSSAAQPVIFRAAPGAEAVVDAGRRISGWEQYALLPGVWRARVAQPSGNNDFSWRFQQLWVNEQRAIPARTPNDWEFEKPLKVLEEGTNARVTHLFTLPATVVTNLSSLAGPELHDIQIVVFHKWDTTREHLDAFWSSSNTVRTTGVKMQPWNQMDTSSMFCLENYLGALDAPGEWFLARDGWLYYYPRPGEDMRKAVVIAPRLKQFLSLTGNAGQAGGIVRNIRFEGLKFRHAEFRIPEDGLPPGQAVMNVPDAAILANDAENIHFVNCAVEHIGSTAFWFEHACRDCLVEHTRIFDVGISGVRIGLPQIAPEAERTSGIMLTNCIIQSGGRITPHAVGVWIGQSGSNVISHCDIGDFYYTAVSVGWRWGYASSVAKGNVVEFNHLHHLGYRILSDMAGVYTLGPSEGTVVRNNVVHDVDAALYGGWGLYPDEGSTGIVWENNLVYDVKDGCLHQHYGKENVFRNNILAFSRQGQVALTRAEPHLSFTFEHNIVYWDEGNLLGYGAWGNKPQVLFRSNLYWKTDGKPIEFAGKSWQQWQAAGNDAGSQIADPLFVDAKARDFRLKPNSPAKETGFTPFDISAAGVQGEPAWRALAQTLTYPHLKR